MAQGGKTVKEIPESSKSEFLDGEDNTSGLLNRRGIVDLPLLRMLLAIRQKFQEPKFLGSDGLFYFIGICKFGSFKDPFARITSLSELIYSVGANKKSDFYGL